jgi:hypothetical protein
LVATDCLSEGAQSLFDTVTHMIVMEPDAPSAARGTGQSLGQPAKLYVPRSLFPDSSIDGAVLESRRKAEQIRKLLASLSGC